MDFEQMMLQKAYEKVCGLGDRLVLMKQIVNWVSFRPLIASVFHDNEKTGGRPHTDELVIARAQTPSDSSQEYLKTRRRKTKNNKKE